MAWRIRASAIKQKQSSQSEDATTQQPEASTSARKKAKIESKDVIGLNYLDLVVPLLKRLHDDDCARDTAGNRNLHFDQYCMLDKVKKQLSRHL